MIETVQQVIYEVARIFGRLGFQVVVTMHQETCVHQPEDPFDDEVIHTKDGNNGSH